METKSGLTGNATAHIKKLYNDAGIFDLIPTAGRKIGKRGYYFLEFPMNDSGTTMTREIAMKALGIDSDKKEVEFRFEENESFFNLMMSFFGQDFPPKVFKGVMNGENLNKPCLRVPISEEQMKALAAKGHQIEASSQTPPPPSAYAPISPEIARAVAAPIAAMGNFQQPAVEKNEVPLTYASALLQEKYLSEAAKKNPSKTKAELCEKFAIESIQLFDDGSGNIIFHRKCDVSLKFLATLMDVRVSDLEVDRIDGTTEKVCIGNKKSLTQLVEKLENEPGLRERALQRMTEETAPNLEAFVGNNGQLRAGHAPLGAKKIVIQR